VSCSDSLTSSIAWQPTSRDGRAARPLAFLKESDAQRSANVQRAVRPMPSRGQRRVMAPSKPAARRRWAVSRTVQRLRSASHRLQFLPQPALPEVPRLARAQWLADRQAELLPVPYFHVVFTVPTRTLRGFGDRGRTECAAACCDRYIAETFRAFLGGRVRCRLAPPHARENLVDWQNNKEINSCAN
jgi:hypothetical protein